MKCLCCNGNFEGLGTLKQHYVEAHNVHENNYFFGNFLQGTGTFVRGNVSGVIIFSAMEEMRKSIIFLNIISKKAPCR